MATTAYGTSGANPVRRNNAVYWAVAIALIALIAFAVISNRTVDTTVAPNAPGSTVEGDRLERNTETNAAGAGAGSATMDNTRDTGLNTGSDTTTRDATPGSTGTATDNLNQDNNGIGSPGTTTDTPTGNN